MNLLSSKSRFVTLIAAVLVGISGSLIAAPSASAAKADFVWYLDRDFREIVDIKGDGNTAGDITIANGTISETRGGKGVGTYALVGVEATLNIPGGRLDRSVNTALTVGKSTIYLTTLVSTNAGVPPTNSFKHAIIGGTGKYSGARGEVVVKPLSATRFKYSFYFVD
ncbi:MAG: hypothetical protein K9G05_04450 [Candidatus Nanopelagicales bacterium]|nr:hypothetical protein [Candidatus Nanopelagicales bacterium]MCF8539618.1 hypothetical protein [Candidatus Nanopelagicales bacterium]MCF8551316.1 hypothetical protein [Candidatus Nanopelagicales bacterium]